MKRIIIIFLAVLALAGCSRLKVEDPARRAELRTRDSLCPIDSVIGPAGLKTTFSIVGQVKPAALASDFKEARAVSKETKAMAKVKDAYAIVKKEHSEEYNPGLTLYCSIMFLVFIVVALTKTVRAIFKNN